MTRRVQASSALSVCVICSRHTALNLTHTSWRFCWRWPTGTPREKSDIRISSTWWVWNITHNALGISWLNWSGLCLSLSVSHFFQIQFLISVRLFMGQAGKNEVHAEGWRTVLCVCVCVSVAIVSYKAPAVTHLPKYMGGDTGTEESFISWDWKAESRKKKDRKKEEKTDEDQYRKMKEKLFTLRFWKLLRTCCGTVLIHSSTKNVSKTFSTLSSISSSFWSPEKYLVPLVEIQLRFLNSLKKKKNWFLKNILGSWKGPWISKEAWVPIKHPELTGKLKRF